MPGRVRQRTTYQDGGSYGTYTRSIKAAYQYTSDVTGGQIDHPFYSEHWINTGCPRISGTHAGNTVSGFIPDSCVDYPNFGNLPLRPDDNAAMTTRTLAITNPNRPAIDVPSELTQAILEVPAMTREVGENLFHAAKRLGRPPRITDKVDLRTVFKQLANANLAIQFGWAPLISDLQKLVNVSGQIDRRMQEFHRLYSKGGLKRRVELFSENLSYGGQAYLQTSTFSATGTYVIAHTDRAWATMKWLPDPNDLVPETFDDRRTEAIKALLGLSANLKTAWDLIPWSWLVDYYTNVGQVLEASRNQVGLIPGSMCVMRQQDAVCTYSDIACSPSLTCAGGKQSVSVKMRYVDASPTPSFTAAVPMINAQQLSILGSLALARFL